VVVDGVAEDGEIEARRGVHAEAGRERADELVVARAHAAVADDGRGGGAVIVDPGDAGVGVAAFGDVPELAGERHRSLPMLNSLD